MFMGIAAVLFAAYFGNVFLGAFGGGPILSEIGEMLLMTASALFFVAAILKREAAAQAADK